MADMPDIRTDAGKAAWNRIFDTYLKTGPVPVSVTVEDIATVEAQARQLERDRILALVFDLPIGDSVDYSRGYSAAIMAIRTAIKETA